MGMTDEDEKVYDEICVIDARVFELQREMDKLLKSVASKRKALRDKGIMC